MSSRICCDDHSSGYGDKPPRRYAPVGAGWMPDNAESEPVPAILEYLPFENLTAPRRETTACTCILPAPDTRACGWIGEGAAIVKGSLTTKYSEQELQDGVDIINWIAAQPWCTGKVGIQGISWGGFNGLQIAARAPEALKAVISIARRSIVTTMTSITKVAFNLAKISAGPRPSLLVFDATGSGAAP